MSAEHPLLCNRCGQLSSIICPEDPLCKSCRQDLDQLLLTFMSGVQKTCLNCGSTEFRVWVITIEEVTPLGTGLRTACKRELCSSCAKLLSDHLEIHDGKVSL